MSSTTSAPARASAWRSGSSGANAHVPNDLLLISPLIAAVLAATAVLLVDLAAPGRRTLAVATTLAGLAAVAVVTIAVGQEGARYYAATAEQPTAFGGSYTV